MGDEYDDLLDSVLPKPSRPSRPARRGVTRFQPATEWTLEGLKDVEDEFLRSTGRPLPVSVRGQGRIHNKWGLQHQNSADVGVRPGTPEGKVLEDVLRRRNVPFLAFDRAIPGVATGPHFHIGKPSRRGTQASAPPRLRDEYDVLLDEFQGQTPPRQINRDSETALQPASTLQQSVPVSTGRFGAPQSKKFSRPLRPSRPKQSLADIATGGVGVVAPPGVGELRRLDDPATQQITRIQRQVTAEQTPVEREMRRAPGAQNARLLEEKLTENEEVIRRLEQEQDTAKREAAAAAEAKRLMTQFTRQDKAEIAEFVDHLKGKGSTYTGIRTGARAVGSSGLYKLAGLTDIANAVQKPLTGQDSWIPDFLKRKALAGELSVEEIPVEQRGQVAEFITQLGLGLAEIAVTPGGPVGKFAGLSGTESIGRGQSAKEIAKETAKGATVGAVFKAAPMLNRPAQTVRGRAANLAREGAGIGAGTYAVERGFGTPEDEAALSAATNVVLHGVLGARRLRGRKTDAGQAEAQRQGIQTEQPVEAVEGQPVVSKVEAPQGRSRFPLREETAQREAEVIPERIADVTKPVEGVGPTLRRDVQLPAADSKASVVEKQSIPEPELPRAKFVHKDFGEVVAVENQSGVARGSVRVVDRSGAEHVIQRPNGRGEGNVRAIPIKERVEDASRESAALDSAESRLLERETQGERPPATRPDISTKPEVPLGDLPVERVPPAVEQAERRRIQREFDKIKESSSQPPSPETVRVEPETPRTEFTRRYRDTLAGYEALDAEGRAEFEAATRRAGGEPIERIREKAAQEEEAHRQMEREEAEAAALVAPKPETTSVEQGVEAVQSAEMTKKRAGQPEGLAENAEAPLARPEKYYRGSNADRGKGTDQFYSSEREVAEEYAAPMKVGGKPGRVEEVTPDRIPANLYEASNKEALQRELGVTAAPYSAEFDSQVKAALQAKGYAGVRYLNGTFDAEEVHVFGSSKTQPTRNEAVSEQPIKEVSNETTAPLSGESLGAKVNQVRQQAEGKAEAAPNKPITTSAAPSGQPELSSTAAKREKITADRAARGEEPLPKPLVTRKSDERLLADAKEANTKDPTEPIRLIDQVRNGKKGALSDKETVQVDLHVQELKNKYDAVNKRLTEAKDPAAIKELSEQSDAMEREMRSAEEALAVSGTEKGRALRAQRVEIDQDFRLLTMISRATKAHGRELTRDERATIKEQHDRIAELETKLSEANERAARAEAERAVGRIKSDVAKENRRAGRRVKRESLDQEAAELRSLIAQAWKRQSTGGEIHSAMGLAKLDPEGEVTKLVVQLAKNRIQAKVGLKAEALVDEVHGLLKDVVDLNRREVAEMISGYGKTYELSKDAVDVRLRELKSIIAANLGKADIIEKGIRPLRRGLQRDKPTQEVRAAMRELRDTLREHGMRVERSKGSAEEQQQSALDAAKTRTKNRIEDLSKWIKDGKRTVANKTEIIPDPELKTLQAERDRLQKVFEAIVDPAADLKKIENSLRSVNKSIIDLEAKIRAGNIAAKPREKGLTSPELEAARAEQKALRGIITDLRKAAKPQPTTPEIEAKRLLSANKALNTRMEKQIADLERRMKQGDFSKPQKREPVPYSRENLALQKQLEQIKQAYARANYRASRKWYDQVGDEMAKAGNLPKTLKSMGDISAVFRQGGFYSITHPVAGFVKPSAAMLRSFTETGFRNVEQAIKNHPKFEQAKRDGVEFTGIDKADPNLSHREESFFGGETVDVLARGKYNPLRAVKASKDFSQRTFVSFLDSQRMHIYDVMSEGLKTQGLTPRSSPESYKGIARLINIGTGRGSLGKTGNQAAPLLNIAMFSPRLVVSRVQLLNNMFNPVAMARMPKAVREQSSKDNVKFLAATAAFMGLATAAGGSVNLDPDDADYLKIRFGNTTYDTLTGLQQPLRYIANMYRAATMGDTYPGQSKAEMTKRFLRSKASPAASPVINWFADEDFMGRKFSLKREASEIVLPLPAKDFWEAMEKEGLVKGFLKATPALTGVGVQTYEQPPEKPKTAAEKLARKFVRDRIPDVARDEEEIERSEKKALLRSRARKGEDVTAEVEALGIPERQQKAILAAKGVTRLQEDFKRLGLKEALTVYSVMTRGEQQQVKDILATKAMNTENLSDDERAAMNKRLELIGLTPPSRSQRKRPERPSRPSRKKQQGYQWATP